MTTHHLTIEPGVPGGYTLTGRLVFADGTETVLYADERARLLARAREAIEQHRAAQEMQTETVVLDDFGEIVREPSEWSVKVNTALPAEYRARLDQAQADREQALEDRRLG